MGKHHAAAANSSPHWQRVLAAGRIGGRACRPPCIITAGPAGLSWISLRHVGSSFLCWAFGGRPHRTP